jgi:hypothetical protein
MSRGWGLVKETANTSGSETYQLGLRMVCYHLEQYVEQIRRISDLDVIRRIPGSGNTTGLPGRLN